MSTLVDASVGTRTIVVFALDGTEYGLPVDRVREIIRYVPQQATAAEQPWLRGVINLRGSIIPVCDLRMRLRGDSEPNDDPKARILVLDDDGDQAGVIVGQVDEVRTILPDEIEPAPSGSSELIEAIAKLDDRLVVLLRADLLSGTA